MDWELNEWKYVFLLLIVEISDTGEGRPDVSFFFFEFLKIENFHKNYLECAYEETSMQKV